MNDIVIAVLEGVFGIWVINTMVEFLFDIDLIGYVRQLLKKLLSRNDSHPE